MPIAPLRHGDFGRDKVDRIFAVLRNFTPTVALVEMISRFGRAHRRGSSTARSQLRMAFHSQYLRTAADGPTDLRPPRSKIYLAFVKRAETHHTAAV
jgi:hypothetical protein